MLEFKATRSGLETVVVCNMNVAQAIACRQNWRRHARFFDIHVKEVSERGYSRMVDRGGKIDRLLNAAQKSRFVAVERLEKYGRSALRQRNRPGTNGFGREC